MLERGMVLLPPSGCYRFTLLLAELLPEVRPGLWRVSRPLSILGTRVGRAPKCRVPRWSSLLGRVRN